MANVVKLSGVLLAGPPPNSCSGTPSGLVNVAFELTPSLKGGASSGYQVRNLNAPSAYAPLGGIGDDQTVSQATTLYLRTRSPMMIRITTENNGNDVVAVIPVEGLFILECPASSYLKLVEAQGVGVVEWFAAGSQ